MINLSDLFLPTDGRGILKDCDDDGETHAGKLMGRLGSTARLMDAKLDYKLRL